MLPMMYGTSIMVSSNGRELDDEHRNHGGDQTDRGEQHRVEPPRASAMLRNTFTLSAAWLSEHEVRRVDRDDFGKIETMLGLSTRNVRQREETDKQITPAASCGIPFWISLGRSANG